MSRIRRSILTSLAMFGVLAGGALLSAGVSCCVATSLDHLNSDRRGWSMIARSLALKVATALCALLGALLLSSAPALANYVPGVPASFGSPAGPTGVAVDQAHGVVYVAGAGAIVEKFNEGGTPENFSGLGASELTVPGATPTVYQLAVDNSTSGADPSKGDVYVADYGDGVVDRYTEAGTLDGAPIGGLTVGAAVAVDSAGNLYVAQYSAGNVLEYSPTGTPLNGGAPVLTGLTEPNALAFNSHDDLYVAGRAGTFEFAPNGSGGFTQAAQLFAGESFGVAVNLSTNHVFVDNYSSIEEYDEAGSKVGNTFVSPGLGASNSIAVSDATKTVFATNGSTNAVETFVPEQPLSAKTLPATVVTSTTAMLHAKVALEGGGKVKYHFDYGTTTAYGAETPEEEVTVTLGAPEAEVTAEIPPLLAPPLEPGKTYDYKIVATDTAPESAEGANETLSTELEKPKEVETGGLEAATATSATLGSLLEPNKLNPGGEAKYYIEYGEAPCDELAETCGTKSAEATATGSAQQEVPPIAVSGLNPNTIYHYWIAAKNSAGTVHGSEREFTTKPAAPSVQTGVAEDVTETSAKLTGELNPGAAETEYYVEYLLPSNGVERSATAFVSGRTLVSVTPIVVRGLQPNTTYYYWLVAKNSAVSEPVRGEARQFTTPRSHAEIEAQAAANGKPAEELAAAAAARQKLQEEAKRAEETAAAANAAKQKQYDEIAAETAGLLRLEAQAGKQKAKAKKVKPKPASCRKGFVRKKRKCVPKSKKKGKVKK